LAPLVSESFTNNAAGTAGTFHADARPVTNANAAGATLSISYDAVTGSYTVVSPRGTQSFASANIDSAESSSVLQVFKKTSGALTESLSLTGPGTSGALTYQYVGAGFFERTNRGTNTVDFSFDAFTYGVETLDASLPRTGTAAYAVDLVGARASDTSYALAGYGTLRVDFVSGALATSGTIQTVSLTTGSPVNVGDFFGSASISSLANSFTGSFQFDDGTVFTGNWAGRFYGPTAQEVGAAFSATAANGEIAAGALIGRQDSTVAQTNFSLNPLRASETFAARSTVLTYAHGTALPGGVPVRQETTLAFDAATGSYRYVDSDNSIDQSFAPGSAQPLVAGSDMNRYRITAGDGYVYDLALSRMAGANPAVTLTYLSYGQFARPSATGVQGIDRWFTWGVRTNSFQLPRTGSANFAGIIRGTGITANGGPVFTLGGTSSFAFNFASATFTGSLTPTGTNTTSGAVTNFGTYNLGGGTISSAGGLAANVVSSSNGFLGYFDGALYGPQATEIGAVFGFNNQGAQWDGSYNTGAVHLNGVVAATKTGQ
jgi:hypothetical protein